jgi:sortase A
MKREKSKVWRRISLLLDILIIGVITAGVVLMLYPPVSYWWNGMHESRAIASYVEKVADSSAEDSQRMWDEASAYNQSLLAEADRFRPTPEEDMRYRAALDITGTGIMGYVNIPSIRVHLPIYHGTDPTILQIAVGHMEGSSLPVGGEGTHCVISGHTGLPSAKLFTDLTKVQEGDTFTLSVLDQTLTYQVDQILVVLPEETDALAIDPDQDYCTLVTCTPYGVNSHRLLVRGHRIPTVPDDRGITADAVQVEPIYIVPYLAAVLVAMVFGYLLMLFVRSWRQRKAGRREETS